MPTNEFLTGKTVIVTRPLAQAQNMCELLERHNAKVVHFPVISIATVKDVAAVKNTLQQLSCYDRIIFISANAVHYAMQLAQEMQLHFPAQQLTAIGPATKTALENYGYHISIVPTAGFTSEALLAHKSLSELAEQRILIIRGVGGREHLRQELQRRGAQVDYAEVYQRQLPQRRNAIELNTLSSKDTAVLIYSAESAQNMWLLCSSDEQQWLSSVTHIAGSARIAEKASSVGFAKNLIIAENPSDVAMLDALIGWSKKKV